MIKRILFVLTLSAAPMVALAQPADHPSPPLADRPAERPRPGRGTIASERDIEEVSAFMADNAPNRWNSMQDLPDDMRRNVLNFIVARYRGLQQIKDSDPELYQTKLNQFRTEDDIYGLVSVRGQEQREKSRDQIEAKVRKFIELNIAERTYRLERLKKQVSEEEARLASDRGVVDEQVKRRTDTLISEGTGGLRRDIVSNWVERRRPTTGPASVDTNGDRPDGRAREHRP